MQESRQSNFRGSTVQPYNRSQENRVIIYFHLIPAAGLANRLRAYASAAWIAEAVGARLIIDWRADQAHGARFGDLFTTLVDEGVEKTSGLPRKVLPMHLRRLPLKLFDGARPDRVVELDTCFEVDVIDAPADWPPLTERIRKHLACLEPVPEVQQRVSELTSMLGGESLGIHIRAGEDVRFLSDGNVTAEQFLTATGQLAAELPEVKFYVASDSAAAVARFIERYGDRVITAGGPAAPVKRRNAATVEGVREALIDLLVLGRTRRILGTYFSSFSWLAAVAGAVPMMTLANRPRELSA